MTPYLKKSIMPIKTDIEKDDTWSFEEKQYKVVGTGLLWNGRKGNKEVVIIFKSNHHPLFFVLSRQEFLKKFEYVKR